MVPWLLIQITSGDAVVVTPPTPEPKTEVVNTAAGRVVGSYTGPAFPRKKRPEKQLRDELQELESLRLELLERAAANKTLKPVERKLKVISPLTELVKPDLSELQAAISAAQEQIQIELEDEAALVAILVAIS